MVRVRLRPQLGWLGLPLVVLMLMSMVWSIETAKWVAQLPAIGWLAMFALLFGVLSAKSKLPWFLAHFVLLLTGVGVVGYVGTTLIERGELWDRVVQVVIRVNAWAYAARTGGINNDNLPFVVLLLLMTWIIGYYSAWSIYRTRRGLGAVVPSGIAILINVSYGPKSLSWYLLIYVLSALLLLVHMNYLRMKRAWGEMEIRHSDRVGVILLRDATVVGLIIMMAAWFAPTAEAIPGTGEVFAGLSEPWRNFQGDFNRLFASIASRERPFSNDFGNALALRSGTNLSEEIAMKVVSEESHYWRAIAYDRYTGQGWLSSPKEKEYLPAHSSTAVDESYLRRKTVNQKFTIETPKNDLFFAAGTPESFDFPANIEHDSGAAKEDVTAARGAIVFRRGQSYSVDSSVSVASVQELRQAGAEYPQWVQDRYLQLPQRTVTRVKTLTEQLIRSSTNNYDRATVVEDYLRRLTYDRTVGDLPHNRDMVEFFLFTSRKGYCDYFSTAMAVMLRTVGVPARVVAGYMVGNYDSAQGAYIVKESDAHSWTEVYFPEYGWIEFDPTSANPRISRPLVPAAEPTIDMSVMYVAEDFSDFSEEIFEEGSNSRVNDVPIPWQVYWPFLLVAATLSLAWLAWTRGLSKLVLELRAYEQVCRLSTITRTGHKKHETPLEFAGRLKESMPDSGNSMEVIANAYTTARYGKKTFDEAQRESIKRAWIDLSRRMVRRLWP